MDGQGHYRRETTQEEGHDSCIVRRIRERCREEGGGATPSMCPSSLQRRRLCPRLVMARRLVARLADSMPTTYSTTRSRSPWCPRVCLRPHRGHFTH
eukprot:scaffold284696_cov36-Tisochrysis_lutea.AAC.1